MSKMLASLLSIEKRMLGLLLESGALMGAEEWVSCWGRESSLNWGG